MIRARSCLLTGMALMTPSIALTQSALPRTPWHAQWISVANAQPQAPGVFHFRKSIDLAEIPEHFVVNISADNRYRLFVNGQLTSSGPARGDPSHWRYETVDLASYLHAGHNTLAALVWNWGEYRPVAQMSLRTGFLLSGATEHVADTDGSWKAITDQAYSFTRVGPPDDGGFYAASPGENLDARLYPWGWESSIFDDSGWPAATPLTSMPALNRATEEHGQSNSWQLVPRNIPSMEERPVSFARVRRSEGMNVDTGFLIGGHALLIPAHHRISVLLDQSQLTTGYLVLAANGGAGASVTLTYAEALFDADGHKGNRDDIVGRQIRGLRDRITFDGGARHFQSLWLRTFRYVQLDVETKDAPLEITDIHSLFSAYPFESRASFTSDQRWISDIWSIDWRMLRLSAFETFWDTPYYEQLQYVGDCRIESLLSLYNTGDDRLMRNAIELFDSSRSAEGLTGSRYPSDPAQYIPPFSLWWVAMIHDYWMLREDPAFVQRFLPGIRGVLDWYERHIDGSGMLGPMPWWNFLDWTDAFERGVPPGAEDGHSTAITLQYIYALQRAAEMEAALGIPELGARDRSMADRLITTLRERTWNESRQLFSDSLEGQSFSQQTNALAVLTGAARDRRALATQLLSDARIVQASYYFRFYVDEAMYASGLADRYLPRLDPWREMVRNGLTTTPETPDPSRSDSHAWSAHPNYHLLATVLGVRPGSPGFRSVVIAPALGSLKWVEGSVPHPAGDIRVHLARVGLAGVKGIVTLPPNLSGRFLWGGRTLPLLPGQNIIKQ